MRVNGTKPNHKGRASGKIYGRAGAMQKPPPGEPWVWLSRELLSSDAWRTIGINGRRFIDFLMLEHMAHAGTENGNLMATYKQLEVFGINRRFAAAAIVECEESGLVDRETHGARVASTYTLTWLPTAKGDPPTNRWKAYKCTADDRNKNRFATVHLCTELPYKGTPRTVQRYTSDPQESAKPTTVQRDGPSISRTGGAGTSQATDSAPPSPPSASSARRS